MQPRIRKTLLISSGMLVAIYLALYAIAAAVFPNEVTNVNQYSRILKGWSSTNLVRHFPDAIPSSAKKIRLSFIRGFLQGGSHFQLRLKLPHQEIEQIEAALRRENTHQYAGGSMFEHYNHDQENNFPTTSFYTADNFTKTYEFPSHYTLYVLHASNHGGMWNHGETCGTALSSQLDEVVYWAEAW